MKGKYGYYDPEGVLREATYGAGAGRGFEPEIQGVDLPPPTIVEGIQNEIPDSFQPEIQNQQRFKNFKAQSVLPKRLTSTPEKSAVKIVNGRRAVLKKRLRAKTILAPAQFVDTQFQRKNNLRAWSLTQTQFKI